MHSFLAAFIIADKEGTAFEDGPLDLKKEERQARRDAENFERQQRIRKDEERRAKKRDPLDRIEDIW